MTTRTDTGAGFDTSTWMEDFNAILIREGLRHRHSQFPLLAQGRISTAGGPGRGRSAEGYGSTRKCSPTTTNHEQEDDE